MSLIDPNPPIATAGRQFIINQPKNQPILFKSAIDFFTNYNPKQGGDLDCRKFDQRIYAPEYSKAYLDEDGVETSPDQITFQLQVFTDWPSDINMQCEVACTCTKDCRRLRYYVDMMHEDGTRLNPPGTEILPDYIRFYDDGTSTICFSIPVENSYSTDDFDVAVQAGCYYLRLGVYPEACTDERYLLATSQIFKIIDAPKCDQITIQWGNTNDAYDFVFNDPTPLFFTRIYALGWKPKYAEDSSKFKDSKGNRYILSATSQELYELLIDELPEYMHRALRIAFLSNYLLIDGQHYDVESKDYTPEWRNDSNFAQARIEISKSHDEKIKNNCSVNLGTADYPGTGCIEA